MTVTTRWLCDICDDVCETRPFFKFYPHGRKTALGVGKWLGPDEGEWRCSTCGHPPKNHGFTFLKPKAKRDKE